MRAMCDVSQTGIFTKRIQILSVLTRYILIPEQLNKDHENIVYDSFYHSPLCICTFPLTHELTHTHTCMHIKGVKTCASGFSPLNNFPSFILPH